MPPLASPRTRSLCSYWMFPARYMGVGCAVQVRGRSRRSIRRLRRAIFWCLLVLTRNVLHVIRSVLVWSPNSAMWYDISSFSFTRAANALVLGLVIDLRCHAAQAGALGTAGGFMTRRPRHVFLWVLTFVLA